MNIKRNIIFSLESQKKDGIVVAENIPIRMRVVYAGMRVEFSTGYRIDAAKWDNEKQRVKKRLYQQIQTDRFRNQRRPVAILYGRANDIQTI